MADHLTRAQRRRVLELFVEGRSTKAIAERLGCDQKLVDRVVLNDAGVSRDRAKRVLGEMHKANGHQPPAPDTAPPVAADPAGGQPVVDVWAAPVEDVLAMARVADVQTLRTRADRIATGLDELRRLVAQHVVLKAQRQKVTELRRQLSQAEQQLERARRQLTVNAGPTPARAVDAKKARNRRIRDWARAHNLNPPDRGVIPKHIVAAYLEAHPDDRETAS